MNNLLTQKFPIAAFALLFVLTISCSHEPAVNDSNNPNGSNVHEWEDSTIDGDATMTRMAFSVGDSINVVRQGQTRATTTVAGVTTFQVNDIVTIGVAGKSAKDYKITNTTSGALAYNGTATDAYCWQSTSETVSLRAWSYGNTTTNSGDPDNAVYTLPTDQSSNYGELLYAPATNYDYATYNSSIPITLYHQLARLVINLEHIKTGDLNVSEIYIGDGTDAVIPTTAKFHKPTSGNIGTWDNIGTEKGKITPKTETANACYSAVLIPGTYAANQKFMVIKTSDSRTYCYIPSSPIVLAAGNQYNYTISVKDLKEASTLTIADIAAYTYDGTAKEPHPTVTDGSKTLTEGTDYTLSWSNNTNAGTATVTVTGMGGYYNGTQSKNFTINKASGAITNLSSTNLSLSKTTTSGTVTVTRNGDGAVTATSSDTFIATVSVSGNVVTVNVINDGTATITIKVNEGTNYTAYTGTDKTTGVTVSGFREYKMNPLWFVATKNMISSTAAATSDNQGSHFKWATAMSYFAAQTTSYSTYKNANKTIGSLKYHLPVKGEAQSIMPAPIAEPGIWGFDNGSGTYKSSTGTSIFGYNSTTKAGISEASYWKKISNTEFHAIRFLGTYYCSAWKYELLGGFTESNYGYLRISSTLIGKVENSKAAAEAWYNARWSNVYWGSNDSKFAAQRVFYGRGYGNSPDEAESATSMVGQKGYFWTATEYSSNQAWNMNFYTGAVYIDWTDHKGGTFNVRLFKDN